eukprot:scaffold42957_cov31-Tisochrysis_lutea.AAC.3
MQLLQTKCEVRLGLGSQPQPLIHVIRTAGSQTPHPAAPRERGGHAALNNGYILRPLPVTPSWRHVFGQRGHHLWEMRTAWSQRNLAQAR